VGGALLLEDSMLVGGITHPRWHQSQLPGNPYELEEASYEEYPEVLIVDRLTLLQ